MNEMTQEYQASMKPQRLYKDRIFRMIFSEKKELLSLYNAINETDYQDTDMLVVNTLEHAIYMGMRNDLSFLIDSRLSLYEHQSTYNPNIPLRDFLYSANLYSRLTIEKNLYGSKLVRIPSPRYIVFYNGMEEQPERKEMLLSDAFEVQEPEKSLELKVLMLNINPGYNENLKKNCKTLRDYMYYVEKVRSYAHTVSLEEAVDRAIGECIADDVLADFLRNNRAEAKSMSIFEYDEELHMRQERETAREDGLEEGRQEGRQQGLQQGEEKILSLIHQMSKDGLTEKVPKLTTDKTFLQEMLRRYNL